VCVCITREGSARAARTILRLDVAMATQTVVGARGSNDTAEGFVTAVNERLEVKTHESEKKGKLGSIGSLIALLGQGQARGIIYKYANCFYARDIEREVARSGDVRQRRLRYDRKEWNGEQMSKSKGDRKRTRVLNVPNYSKTRIQQMTFRTRA